MTLKIESYCFTWHSSSWWCTTIPRLVTKVWHHQKTYRWWFILHKLYTLALFIKEKMNEWIIFNCTMWDASWYKRIRIVTKSKFHSGLFIMHTHDHANTNKCTHTYTHTHTHTYIHTHTHTHTHWSLCTNNSLIHLLCSKHVCFLSFLCITPSIATRNAPGQK